MRPPPRAGHGESFLNSRPFTLTLAVALALASPDLSAMGLGPLQVKSGLNQPLVAEIPIISATPAELEALDVRLASPEAFARIGLERPGELTANLQFSVGENARGQPVILVTTPSRFSEPLLNFLIEADWGKGAVTREYTALIDPPYIAPAVVRPMQAPATAVASAPVTSAPVAEPELPAAEPPAPAAEPEVAASAAAPVAVTAPPAAAADSDLKSRRDAVQARPQDLEAHLSLLRLFHARGNAVDYEQAAQAMRAQVGSPMEPRWREAVVMGASLMPGHPLFSQAGWNTPRYETEPKPAAAAAPAPAAAVPAAEEVKVFEFPEEPDPQAGDETAASREINLGAEAAVIDETFGDSMRDIHRDEAKMLAEDAPSATRIELAKAYLDIGDLDGARGMLEEVLIEGGPTAKAEAARILQEMG